MKPVIKITLTDEEGLRFFGEGPCRLLRAVEETGSLRAAAASMGMAYSKATRLLRQAESALGFPLTSRTTGGRDGGGSHLTEEGKLWLARYETYRDACEAACRQLYRQHFPKTGCVIMASGLGKRFGSNKLMAEFCGRPLICRALEATQGLFDQRVVVTRHEAVAELCKNQKIPVVLHDLPHRSDTVRLGLEALTDVQCCLFLPGDQPLLRRETVVALLEHWRREPKAIWRPQWEQQAGSPVLFPAWAFPELAALPEGKGGSWVIRQHPQQVCTVPVADPMELMDADTKQTLQQLQQYEQTEKKHE